MRGDRLPLAQDKLFCYDHTKHVENCCNAEGRVKEYLEQTNITERPLGISSLLYMLLYKWQMSYQKLLRAWGKTRKNGPVSRLTLITGSRDRRKKKLLFSFVLENATDGWLWTALILSKPFANNSSEMSTPTSLIRASLMRNEEDAKAFHDCLHQN